MVAYPVMIGNEGVLDTEIMQATDGRIVAKLGAEGLLCLAVPDRGLGIAIASDDGMPRGLGPAAIAVLEQLELADDGALCALASSSPAPSQFQGRTCRRRPPRPPIARRLRNSLCDCLGCTRATALPLKLAIVPVAVAPSRDR